MSDAVSAHATLAKKQQASPPPATATDRVALLVAALRPSLPPALAALLDGDTLAGGELGDAHPDVATWTLGDNAAHLITYSSGMFAFTEAVARPLSALFVEGRGSVTTDAFERVAVLLRDAMQTYRRQTHILWSLFRPQFDIDAIEVAPAFVDVFAELGRLTGIFLLAHEFGHVAIATNVRARTDALEELDADRFGLEFSLRAALESNNQQLAVTAAGLAIRMLVSLQRAGVTFTSDYPPMTQRLDVLAGVLEELVGSRQRRDELSRMMVAMLDAMDDLDNRIEPSLPPLPITEDRVRVGLIARLYEVARGNVPVATFVSDAAALAEAAGPEMFGAALNDLCAYYWEWAVTKGAYIRDLDRQTTYTHEWLIANSQALRAIIAELPPALAGALNERYRAN